MLSIFSIDQNYVGYAPGMIPAVAYIAPRYTSPAAGLAVDKIAIKRVAGAGFIHTAGWRAYAAIFGERLGAATITGLLYAPRACTGLPFSIMSPTHVANSFYYRHGLSQGAMPLYLSVLGGTVCGYLTDMQVSSSHAQLPQIWQFTMNLRVQ